MVYNTHIINIRLNIFTREFTIAKREKYLQYPTLLSGRYPGETADSAYAKYIMKGDNKMEDNTSFQ